MSDRFREFVGRMARFVIPGDDTLRRCPRQRETGEPGADDDQVRHPRQPRCPVLQ